MKGNQTAYIIQTHNYQNLCSPLLIINPSNLNKRGHEKPETSIENTNMRNSIFMVFNRPNT